MLHVDPARTAAAGRPACGWRRYSIRHRVTAQTEAVVVDYVGTLYHVGVRVVDLEAAMAELGKALGITWASVVERDQAAWTPAEGSFTTPLRFTYSCEGPQH